MDELTRKVKKRLVISAIALVILYTLSIWTLDNAKSLNGFIVEVK